jgi:hypothetical protein
MKLHMKFCLFSFVTGLVLGFPVASAFAQQAPVPLTIASSSGQAQYIPPGGTEPVMAAGGTVVSPGTELRTGENGEMTLILFPRLAVTLKPGTRLRIEERTWPQDANAAFSSLIDMPEGRIVVLISDPPAGQTAQEIDLQIRTPQGIARPRGTFYAVLVKDGKSYLAVREGMVGLEQFQPLETETPAEEEKLPRIDYGASTTTSPRG